MISVSEALDIIAREVGRLDAESVPLAQAPGRVLAEDIIADSDLPPFDRSQMDGYAVRAVDTERAPIELRIVGEAAAGLGWRGELKSGEAVRIMTGAPVPRGADAVQQLELASEAADGTCVRIEQATAPDRFVVRRGSEVRAGTRVAKAGASVTPQMVAALASFGYARVRVGVQPRLAVIATGAELVAVDHVPAEDQIRDSNSHMLAAYGAAAGVQVTTSQVVGDDARAIEREIVEAARDADMILLSGGVSVGAYDHTKAALASVGARTFFERVRIRPGKPTVFARLNDVVVFGLPGNPVSSAVTFHLFARTALRIMQGARASAPVTERALLGSTAKRSPERASYLPCTLHTTDAGVLTAELLKWGGSSDFVAFAGADALAVIEQGGGLIEANTIVDVVRLPNV